MNSVSSDLLERLDDAPLNARFWTPITLMTVISVFDYFDFFVVGYLISVVGPAWHLTYAQSAVVLLSGGVGAIVGALFVGILSDRWGRKGLLIVSVVVCALSSGSIAFIPDGAWRLFALLRFFVGVGLAGAGTAIVTLGVEMTPTRVRTWLVSALSIPVSIGIIGAAAVSALLIEAAGWRGLAAIGFAPLVLALAALIFVPESVRWLLSRQRVAEAVRIGARQLGVPADSLTYTAPPFAHNASNPGFSALYKASPRRFWLVVLVWLGFSTTVYGVILWGPTVVSLLLGWPAQRSAQAFVVVALMGIVGRVIFSAAPYRFGRVRCGQVIGFGSAALITVAAFAHDAHLGSVPIFLIALSVGALFFDGGAVNIVPLANEIYPVRLAGRAGGLGQAASGVGKLLGAVFLALIAGTGNLVSPAATNAAVTPGFLFLAAGGLIVGLAFTFLGVEPHGRRINLDTVQPDPADTAALPSALP